MHTELLSDVMTVSNKAHNNKKQKCLKQKKCIVHARTHNMYVAALLAGQRIIIFFFVPAFYPCMSYNQLLPARRLDW